MLVDGAMTGDPSGGNKIVQGRQIRIPTHSQGSKSPMIKIVITDCEGASSSSGVPCSSALTSSTRKLHP